MYVERSSDWSGPSIESNRRHAAIAMPLPEAGSCRSTHAPPRSPSASIRARAPANHMQLILAETKKPRKSGASDALEISRASADGEDALHAGRRVTRDGALVRIVPLLDEGDPQSGRLAVRQQLG